MLREEGRCELLIRSLRSPAEILPIADRKSEVGRKISYFLSAKARGSPMLLTSFHVHGGYENVFSKSYRAALDDNITRVD